MKLKVLNSKELSKVYGGNFEQVSCSGPGDTIICGMGSDVKACWKFEATCPQKFTSDCSIFKKVSITCPSAFSIKKGN
jgi:bacteriocin-like protein